MPDHRIKGDSDEIHRESQDKFEQQAPESKHMFARGHEESCHLLASGAVGGTTYLSPWRLGILTYENITVLLTKVFSYDNINKDGNDAIAIFYGGKKFTYCRYSGKRGSVAFDGGAVFK